MTTVSNVIFFMGNSYKLYSGFKVDVMPLLIIFLREARKYLWRNLMEKTSMNDKRCCCIDRLCRKLDDESDCMQKGGKIVDSCSKCH